MIGSNDDVVLFDTNILVYAHDIDSPNYEKAKELQNAVNERELQAAVTPQNLLEFYSTVTSRARAKRVLNQTEAVSEVKKFLLSPFELITPTGDELEIVFFLTKGKNFLGRKIFDAYLVATMLSNGITTVYTANDRDFKIFKEIKVVNPFNKPNLFQ